MSEEYQKCLLRVGADTSIKKPTKEICWALITDTMDVINIYSPGTSWTKAAAGARNLECGYAQIVCNVTFEPLPQFKLYKPLEELTVSNTPTQQQTKPTDFSKFIPVEINPFAMRTFKSINSTNFLGIKVKEEIVQVFPRGTPMELISTLTLLFEGDVVLVKAKAEYEITDLVKMEKTYEQLRQN